MYFPLDILCADYFNSEEFDLRKRLVRNAKQVTR